MRRRVSRPIVAMLLVLSVFAAALSAGAVSAPRDIQPRFTGISSIAVALDISSTGRASCYGNVSPNKGYSVDLTLELQRDGETIKTWTASGSRDFSIDKIYYVLSGYEYQTVVTATIKNSSGTVVSTVSETSPVSNY